MNPFDHERDAELGRVLREHLGPADPPAFVTRVLQALPLDRSVDSWEVLGQWALPGIAAALLIAASLGFWLGLPRDELNGSGAGATVAEQVLEPGEQLDGSVILAAVLAEP